MFCPNCGTQNDSAATPCKKCGFKLSGISVPKFKGTMVMNSDQTVAEMIEEHRKRQGQGAPADKTKARASEPAPRRNPGSSAPPSSLGGPRGPVLQPPRVAAPTRGRMGGTMLGVAPQVGGHAPPAGAAIPSGGPALPPVPQPGTSSPSAASPESSQSPAAPSSEPSPPPPAASGGAVEAFAGTAEQPQPELSPAAAPAATRPLPAVPSAEERAAPAESAPEPAAAPHEPTPAPPRAVAVTAPLPQVPEASTAEESSAAEQPAPAVTSRPPSPPRLQPLDIVLIILTCGVYGLVLWARQRKPAT